MAVDEQFHQGADRVLNSVRGQLEAELRKLVQDAVGDVRQQAQAQLGQIREAAQRHADELRLQSDTQIGELRAALETVRTRAEADVEDARRIAQAQVDDVQRVMEECVSDLKGQLAEAERRAGETQARVAEAERRAAEAEQQAAEAEQRAAKAEQRVTEAEARANEAEARATEATRHLTEAEDGAHETAYRVAAAVRNLDDAVALGDVFDRLAEAASREAERVAVLVARGDQLHGWTLRGFGDAAPAPRTIVIDPADAAAPPFAADRTARDAVTIPVVVGGTAVAVLYADAPLADPAARQRWTAAVDVLARHASRVLEALTLQQAIGFSRPNSMARASHSEKAGPPYNRS